MRRVLPLLISSLVLLAACGDDDGDAIPELSLVEVESTAVPFADACADGAATSVPGASGGVPGSASEVATPDDGEAASTEPSASLPSESEPSLPVASEPGDSTPPTTEPYLVAPEVSLPAEEPTELVKTVLAEGDGGPAATDGDIVLVYYSGQLTADGTVFDANYGSGAPFAVSLAPLGEPAGVIDGWNEGLHGAHAGEQIQLDIPSDLAYGEEGREGIPPDAALTFVIDVVDVVHLDYPTAAPTELVKTVLAEGDADGQAAQRYDSITLNIAIGVPDVAADDAPGASGPASSEPGGPTSEAPVEPPSSSEPAGSAPTAFTGTGLIVFDTYTANPQTGQPGSPLTLDLIPGTTGIAGLEEALEGARPGDKFQVDLPPELAFGEEGAPGAGVPASSPVSIFVDVIDVTGPPVIDVPDEIPTTLEVTTVTEGDGPGAAEGDTVLVNYVGVVTETNTRIDANWDGQPEALVLGDGTFIEGFEQGLVGAQAGAELQLDIPADLAYQDAGVPDQSVPSDTALTYLVRVAAVIPATAAEDAPTDVDLPLSSSPRGTTIGTDVTGSTTVVEPAVDTTDLVVGTGAPATLGSTAIVNIFAVCATNGAVLQNTWGDDQREFVQLAQGQVIPGLIDGIVGMQVGGRRVVYVPAEQALGEVGSPDLGVGPNRDLIFVVELYGVI